MLSTWVRGFVVVSALAGVVMMIVINHPKRKTLDPGFVLSRMGVGALALSIAYGSAESWYLHVPVAPRIWVVVVALIWFDIGMVWTLLEERQKRKKP